jgi:hypothetical protein
VTDRGISSVLYLDLDGSREKEVQEIVEPFGIADVFMPNIGSDNAVARRYGHPEFVADAIN